MEEPCHCLRLPKGPTSRHPQSRDITPNSLTGDLLLRLRFHSRERLSKHFVSIVSNYPSILLYFLRGTLRCCSPTYLAFLEIVITRTAATAMDSSHAASGQQPNGNAAPAQRPPGPPKIIRKKATHGIFAPSTQKRPPPGIINRRGPPPQLNGHTPSSQQNRLSTPPLNISRSPSPLQSAASLDERVSGFSDPRVQAQNIPFRDYKIVTTKRDLMNGLRFHLMQMGYQGSLDIRNESDFPKPAKLYRRDPRYDPAAQKKDAEEEEPKDGMTTEQRDDFNKRKEARRKEREDNLAQIAPSTGSTRKNNFKKKTQQVFKPGLDEESRKKIMNNYEEKLPWHLEDFDNKHCLVGENQVGSTGVHAAFVQEQIPGESGSRFRMIPVDKVYRFQPKRTALQKNLKIEDVEKMMTRRGHIPDTILRMREERVREVQNKMLAQKQSGLFLGKAEKPGDSKRTDDAGFDYEAEFADDEEGDDLFGEEEEDEDKKLAEKKIKEDQLKANFMDFKDEHEYDEEEEQERREEAARKALSKGYRKALERRERNFLHGSDSEDSSDTDSEEERERLEAERLKNLKKGEESADGKPRSGDASGANTPSARREKGASDRDGKLPKSSSTRSLKRPGSPNLSDASGTDASVARKRKKIKHPLASGSQSASRPMSPDSLPRGSFTSARSGSDTEGAAMSDGGTRIKLKVSKGPDGRLSGRNVSPPTSRPSSPPPRPSSTQPAPAEKPLPTVEEVQAAIPPGQGGISVGKFAKALHLQSSDVKRIIPLIKQVAVITKEKMLVLKTDTGSPAVKNEGD